MWAQCNSFLVSHQKPIQPFESKTLIRTPPRLTIPLRHRLPLLLKRMMMMKWVMRRAVALQQKGLKKNIASTSPSPSPSNALTTSKHNYSSQIIMSPPLTSLDIPDTWTPSSSTTHLDPPPTTHNCSK